MVTSERNALLPALSDIKKSSENTIGITTNQNTFSNHSEANHRNIPTRVNRQHSESSDLQIPNATSPSGTHFGGHQEEEYVTFRNREGGS